MRPRLQAELSVAARSTVGRTPGGTWTVTTTDQLIVVDERLQPVTRFALPPGGSGTHAVSPGAEFAALSLPDRVCVVDRAARVRWEARHPAWPAGTGGSTWIGPDGLVWAVVPGRDGEGSPDRWWVLEAGSGALLHEFTLDGGSAGSDPIGQGDRVLLGVSTSADEDGYRIYSAGYDATGPSLQQMPGSDRVLADVHRRDDRYLTTDRHHEDVALHSLIGGDVLVSRRAEEILDGDFIDFHAAFVTLDRVVVRSVLEQQHLVLDADRLDLLGVVEYPEGAARDAVLPAGEGAWITTDWLDGRVQLWAL